MKKLSSDNKLVWLTINSGAAGKQGAGLERNAKAKQEYGIVNQLLLDESGAVGHAYGAEKTLEPYLQDAVADVQKKVAVRLPETPAWGCTVKYAD